MIKNLFIKGSIFYIIGAIFSLFFSYLFRIILASNLSLEEYGLFYSMLNFILFFLVFRNLGFNQGVVKFGSDFLSKKNFNALRSLLCFVISSQFIISTIFVFIFIFISDFLAQNYFNLLYSSFLFKVFSIYFVTSLLSLLLRPIFRIFYMSKQINTFEPLKNLLIVILFLIFNYFFDSLISAILALVVTPIFVFLIFIPSLSKLISKFTNVGANDYTIIPNFLFFSFPLILSDLGGRFINYFDTFMLTSMKSLIDVGIYNVLLPSASVLLLLASPIILFIVPYLRKNIKNNFLKANIFYKKIINGFLLLSLPIFIFVAFFGIKYLGFLFDIKYLSGQYVFIVLVFGVLLNSLNLINFQFIYSYYNTKIILFVNIISALVNVLLNFFLIPTYGILGAAISTFISYLLIFFLSSHFIKNKFDVYNLFNFNVFLTIFFSLFLIVMLYSFINSIIYLGIIFSFFYFMYLYCIYTKYGKEIDVLI